MLNAKATAVIRQHDRETRGRRVAKANDVIWMPVPASGFSWAPLTTITAPVIAHTMMVSIKGSSRATRPSRTGSSVLRRRVGDRRRADTGLVAEGRPSEALDQDADEAPEPRLEREGLSHDDADRGRHGRRVDRQDQQARGDVDDAHDRDENRRHLSDSLDAADDHRPHRQREKQAEGDGARVAAEPRRALRKPSAPRTNGCGRLPEREPHGEQAGAGAASPSNPCCPWTSWASGSCCRSSRRRGPEPNRSGSDRQRVTHIPAPGGLGKPPATIQPRVASHRAPRGA